jgi:hypothetical protein
MGSYWKAWGIKRGWGLNKFPHSFENNKFQSYQSLEGTFSCNLPLFSHISVNIVYID